MHEKYHSVPVLERFCWQEIRDEVTKANKELAHCIDELNPNASYSIYKATYPFGSEILKDGTLYLPDNKGQLCSLFSEDIPLTVREDLSYNLGSNPVSLILKNSAEIFMKMGGGTVPLYGLIPVGKLFGLWRVLNPTVSSNPTFLWGMTAGARSLFMLPKVARENSHVKLRRALGVNIDTPNNIDDHWQIFKAIDKNYQTQITWNIEILFFAKQWFETLADKKWHEFEHFLLKTAWVSSEYWRNKYIWDVVYSKIQERRNIKFSPHMVNAVKHVLSISEGMLPGFAPAIDNIAGPITKIQAAYLNTYGIQYAPVIMQPYTLSLKIDRPAYYSLQYPITMEFSPKSSLLSSKISDLDHIRSILTKFLEEIENGELNLEGTSIYRSCKHVDYSFFHSNKMIINSYPAIQSTENIINEDEYFVGKKSLCFKQPFSYTSSFLAGCIKVSSKKNVS